MVRWRWIAFADLRRLVDDGQISYPYSTRELVNIVRHMQVRLGSVAPRRTAPEARSLTRSASNARGECVGDGSEQEYPEEGISRILQNVFDFDQYEREVKDLLIRTLQKHGIPVGLESDFKLDLGIEVGVRATIESAPKRFLNSGSPS